MTDPVLELASITLAKGSTEAQLIAASEAFQAEFLDQQDGFLRRELVRKGDGSYLDVVLWASPAAAAAVMEQAQQSEAVGRYFSHMEFDAAAPDAGVESCAVLDRHDKKG